MYNLIQRVLNRDIQKNFETIGESLATDYAENNHKLWEHRLLIHNKTELERVSNPALKGLSLQEKSNKLY